MKSKKLSEQIIKTFKNKGFVLSEPDILLDSEYIIQRSGEKFRSSMLTFENEDGKIMCLRPDLTVASCISFLQKKSKSKIYYSGQAYRRSSNKGTDLINDQLGIEILGSKNQVQDDYEVIDTILNSAKKINCKKIQLKVGDVSLFKSLINSLEMPERWKLRLIRHFWRPEYFEELLKRLEKNSDIDSVTFDTDKKRFYEMKKIDQKRIIAGRSVSEILLRFDNKIKDPRSFTEGKQIVKIIRSFLNINCKLSQLDKKLLAWLAYGFDTLGLSEIFSYTPRLNLVSQKVMQRIGMQHAQALNFEYPALPERHELRPMVVYRLPSRRYVARS